MAVTCHRHRSFNERSGGGEEADGRSRIAKKQRGYRRVESALAGDDKTGIVGLFHANSHRSESTLLTTIMGAIILFRAVRALTTRDWHAF